MKILLAGGSGAIGLPLIGQLREVGHEVVAIHRSTMGREALLAAGSRPIRADVLPSDRGDLREAAQGLGAAEVTAATVQAAACAAAFWRDDSRPWRSKIT